MLRVLHTFCQGPKLGIGPGAEGSPRRSKTQCTQTVLQMTEETRRKLRVAGVGSTDADSAKQTTRIVL